MKITYRPVTKNDLPDRVRWFNDLEISQFLGDIVRSGTTLAKQKKWFEKILKEKNRKDFVIEVDGKPVGGVALLEINKIDKNAGIFIFVGEKRFWGKGVAKSFGIYRQLWI
ncbi:MAG: GNAT family N-acetyltransferase [Candidatus Berkelbacteria bacterium]|nr:GNAT family N-acetyltransferase [Candidatus Berkelbacteria bacterium]